jgi:hypothetical protein
MTAEGVKKPEMMLQIMRENINFFVRQNPQPPAQSPEELAEAFVQYMAHWEKANP